MNPSPRRIAKLSLEKRTGPPDNPQIAYPSEEKIAATLEQVQAYLPDNYRATYAATSRSIIIQGHDVAGWTMEDYVIPRLNSGLIFPEVIA